jgi:hypothetical protein
MLRNKATLCSYDIQRERSEKFMPISHSSQQAYSRKYCMLLESESI